MASVADRLRAEDRAALLALSPTERVRLALALGRRDVAWLRAARPGLTAEAAARRLERQRQVGRRPSAAMAALLG
jgi:hypothetical protein